VADPELGADGPVAGPGGAQLNRLDAALGSLDFIAFLTHGVNLPS
jgi:hypothetical protein